MKPSDTKVGLQMAEFCCQFTLTIRPGRRRQRRYWSGQAPKTCPQPEKQVPKKAIKTVLAKLFKGERRWQTKPDKKNSIRGNRADKSSYKSQGTIRGEICFENEPFSGPH